MSDDEQKRIFAKNLAKYLSRNDITQKEVALAIGVSPQTFNTWVQGIALPRMGKVQALADYFQINKSDLIDEKDTTPEYYLNPQTRDIAQQIYDNRELSLLFDAAKDASPEDLETVHTMLLALKSKEKHGN